MPFRCELIGVGLNRYRVWCAGMRDCPVCRTWTFPCHFDASAATLPTAGLIQFVANHRLRGEPDKWEILRELFPRHRRKIQSRMEDDFLKTLRGD